MWYDPIIFPRSILSNGFVIYQGFHSTILINDSHILLPIGVYTEVESFFLNLEGRLRKTSKVITSNIYSNFSNTEIFQLLLLLNKNF